MKEQFLRQVAKGFAGELKQKPDLQEYTFIFPNRRSSLFFKKYLSEEAGKVILAPRIFTISELYSTLSDLTVLDPVTLKFELWKVYSGIYKDESFDDFFYWCDILLTDFGDIDQYMVNAKQLFTNVKDINEIQADYSWFTKEQAEAAGKLTGLTDFWNNILNASSDNVFKKKFVDIWGNLYEIYTQFREALLGQKKAYPAMRLRAVAEGVKNNNPLLEDKLREIKKAVFIGFSAPTESEKTLMRYFKNHGGDFYWDYFSKEIQAPQNRSSKLIKSCVTEFPSRFKIPEPPHTECVCDAYKVAGQNQQALLLTKILEKTDSSDPMNTAVVLADETLLLPVLSAIPANFRDSGGRPLVNITMGYPLSATPAFSIVKLLCEALQQSRGQTVISLLSHPYLIRLDGDGCKRLTDRIIKANRYSLEPTELREGALVEGLKPELQAWLKMWSEGPAASKDLTTIGKAAAHLLELVKYLSDFQEDTDKGYLYVVMSKLSVISRIDIKIERIRTACSVIMQNLKTESIAFKGEPLQGLQIMGALETRLLDFENIVFLSFNDGVYPKSGEQKSGIPYFLRDTFKLPTYEYQDSISAYNFYRLLQRAKHVHFIYNSVTEGVKTNEESRFLKQLRYDFHKTINEIPVLASKTDRAELQQRKIEKSEEIVERMKDFRFSASLLNRYITCPLQFYLYKYLNFREEELQEEVDASTFGTIFHYVAERVYKKYTLSEMKNTDFTPIIREGFDKFFGTKKIEGENSIISGLVEKYLKLVIEYDLQRDTRSVLVGTEQEVNCDFWGFHFTAKIDRLERLLPDGIPLVIDYKTGNVDIEKMEKEYNSKQFDELLEKRLFAVANTNRDETDKILFQMLLYSAMIQHDKGVEVAVYSLRQIGVTKCACRCRFSEEQIETFLGRLKELMEEITSPEGCFEKRAKTCTYCDFLKYCNFKEKEKNDYKQR